MTITEMKAKSAHNGYHFFDRDTMHFWGSKIHSAPNKYGLFIESHDNFDRTRKLYRVCIFTGKCTVETIEDSEIANTYEHFSTIGEAREFLRQLTKAFNEACTCYREKAVLSDIAEVRNKGFKSGIYTIANTKGETIEVNTNNFARFICG